MLLVMPHPASTLLSQLTARPVHLRTDPHGGDDGRACVSAHYADGSAVVLHGRTVECDRWDADDAADELYARLVRDEALRAGVRTWHAVLAARVSIVAGVLS